MPRRTPLPPELAARAFSVGLGKQLGLSNRRLDAPDLASPFYGVRSSRRAISTVEEQCLAYAPRMFRDQSFSHITAARLWRLPLSRRFDPAEPLHIAASDRNGRTRVTGVTAHRLWPPHHRTTRMNGLLVSDAISTWLQLASILSLDDLIAAGDALVLVPVYLDRAAPAARPYATPDQLSHRVGAFHGPGKRRLVEALDHVRLGCESPKETILRLLLTRNGMPEPELNVRIFGTRSAFVPRVDLGYPQLKVLVEYDGEQHRKNDEQYARDRQRAADLRAAGYTLVTVLKGGLAGDGAARTIADVREALLTAGWHPGRMGRDRA
ncbi:DUF559 domain-containing protein [Subtercola lobariae]|nr:DUF559 domain-containing protein [Subtercola lobariae]